MDVLNIDLDAHAVLGTAQKELMDDEFREGLLKVLHVARGKQ